MEIKLTFTIEEASSVANRDYFVGVFPTMLFNFLVNNTLIVCVHFFLPIFTTDVCPIYETSNSELCKLLTYNQG